MKAPSLRIYLRSISPNVVRKDKVLKVACGNIQVPFTQLIPTHNGFTVVCDKQANIDRLLTENARAKLAGINLSLLLCHLRCWRSERSLSDRLTTLSAAG